jgi:hypothetical protein
VNVFADEFAYAVGGLVVDEVVTNVEVFVVGGLSEVFFYTHPI